MKRYRIFLLSLLSILLTASVYAQNISESDALQIAQKFFTVSSSPHVKKAAVTAPSIREKALTPTTKQTAAYLIDNHGAGYVIVSAVQGTKKQILAYSDGRLPEEGQPLPDQLQYWLNEYANQIEFMQKNGATPRTMPETEAPGDIIVAPLLGNTEWGQEEPYNYLCPEKQGIRCLAGCVATTTAQIMRFHQWPKTGTGYTEYEWYNTFLERDFSLSTYQWQLMQDYYDYDIPSTDESAQAVARLMSDVGIAVKMKYDTLSSSAYDTAAVYALRTYFDYDNGMRYEEKSNYENYYDSDEQQETWNAILREELDAGRPIYYGGDMVYGRTKYGHAFVCDGYDSEDYFHFNLGWDGYCNGWFLTDAINTEENYPSRGFNSNQTAITHIMPNHGGDPYLRVSMGYWSESDYSNRYYVFGVISTTVETSMCVENSQTHACAYSAISTVNTKAWESTGISFSQSEAFSSLTDASGTPVTLADGEYTLYPVCRVEGTKDWQRPYQTSIGEYEYKKPDHFCVEMTDGNPTIWYPYEFEDENFRYRFVNDNEVAIYNWIPTTGSREITYPTSVEYHGKTYPITNISASPSYSITKVTIPACVKTIGDGTFSGKNTLNTVVFEEESNLQTIGKLAFYNCAGLYNIDLPESLQTIGQAAFESCENLKSIHITKHVNEIGDYAFQSCKALTTLTFDPDCELEVIGWSAFDYCTSLTGDIVFPSHLKICYGGFSSAAITSADFSHTQLESLGYRESDAYSNTEFLNCNNLEHVILPPTLKYIGYLYIPYVQNFSLPASVKEVYELSTTLTHLTIPKECVINILSMAKGATIVCEDSEPSCSYLTSTDISAIYIPAGSKEAYQRYYTVGRRSNTYISAPLIEMVSEEETDMDATIQNGEAVILGQSDAGANTTIPESIEVNGKEVPVTTIAERAFEGNSAINNLDIPSSIGAAVAKTRAATTTGIGNYAFAYCKNLCTVTVHWDTPQAAPESAFEGDDLENVVLIVPDNSKSLYQADSGVWSKFGRIVGIEEWQIKPGDANADGIIDVADITAIAGYILGNTPHNFNPTAADANQDGVIDVGDITKTAAIILGQ